VDIWFVRCNGTTGHNQPGTRLYVPGEPPKYPEREFRYKSECIIGGFARIGWPGAGDLRAPDWRLKARIAYPDIADEHLGYLEAFSAIAVGDLVLIPADRDKGDVRIGIVTEPPPGRCPHFDGLHPYHYYFDISRGEWFENAHRVSVRWAPRFATLSCLGRVWPKAFGQVVKGSEEVIAAAAEHSLLAGRT
jgi:hypothetical protein